MCSAIVLVYSLILRAVCCRVAIAVCVASGRLSKPESFNFESTQFTKVSRPVTGGFCWNEKNRHFGISPVGAVNSLGFYVPEILPPRGVG